MTGVTPQTLQVAYLQALQGDLAALIAAKPSLAAQAGEEARAWAFLLSSLWPQVSLETEPSRGPERLGTFEAPASRRLAVEAACARVLRGVLCLDPVAVERWAQAAMRIEVDDGVSRIQTVCAALWQSLFATTAGPSSLAQRAQALQREARGLQCATVVLEAGIQHALALLSSGDVAEALEAARRASLAARAEGLLAQEYLANIVLARARRMNGAATLATRILRALAAVVPPAWRAWLHWEGILAGDRATFEGTPQAEPPTLLRGLIDAAVAGDVPGFEQARARLMALCRTLRPLHEDARGLIALLSVEPEAEAPPAAMASFIDGSRAYPDLSLQGLTASGDGDSVFAWVVYARGRPARRVWGPGLPLVETRLAERFERIPPEPPRQARVYALLASLALAGAQGLSEAEAFERVYGFSFSPPRHVGVLKTLVHRARTELGPHGHLERGAGRMRLHAARPLAIVDPVCQPSLEERVLRAMAANVGTVSAQQAAASVGVSLRYAQVALQKLVEQGQCVVARAGREVAYRLEDTTFFEPTLDRMRPRS